MFIEFGQYQTNQQGNLHLAVRRYMDIAKQRGLAEELRLVCSLSSQGRRSQEDQLRIFYRISKILFLHWQSADPRIHVTVDCFAAVDGTDDDWIDRIHIIHAELLGGFWSLVDLTWAATFRTYLPSTPWFVVYLRTVSGKPPNPVLTAGKEENHSQQ